MVDSFMPTLSLPLEKVDANGNPTGEHYEAFKLWAGIPTNDDIGVVIDNVLPGDVISIYDASGIASFTETDMKMVKSIIGIANAVLTDTILFATDGEAAPFVNLWNSSITNIMKAFTDDKIQHKRRDSFGLDPGTGDTAIHEGGLIVCMPEAHGAIYATEQYYPSDDTHSNGRKANYFSKAMRDVNSFLPSRVKGGQLSATATIGGAVHILAFDSKFDDNAGCYTVGINVVRGNRPSGRSIEDLLNKLLSLCPSSGM